MQLGTRSTEAPSHRTHGPELDQVRLGYPAIGELDPVRLRFTDPEMERRFRVNFANHNITSVRVGHVLAVLMWIVWGAVVHEAARIMAEAGADEILPSETTRMLVGKTNLVFEDRGLREVKGLPNLMKLFAYIDQEGPRRTTSTLRLCALQRERRGDDVPVNQEGPVTRAWSLRGWGSKPRPPG